MALLAMLTSVGMAQGDDRLVGVWVQEEGFWKVDLLFRSDGRYQVETASADPALGYYSIERGAYEVEGQTLTLRPYDYLVNPQTKRYDLALAGGSLSLTGPEGEVTTYQFRTGSRDGVLAGESVDHGLVGMWRRHIQFYGNAEYIFRPDGHYVSRQIPDNTAFSPTIVRGRYKQEGNRLTLQPYSEAEVEYETDFYENTLTLVRRDGFSGASTTFEEVPESEADVRAKAAEAEDFLRRPDWQVGVWEIRQGDWRVDLTLRPDGHYIVEQEVWSSKEVARGRYTLEEGRLRLAPFVGQDLYTRSYAAEQAWTLDYYDGELQLIDLEAILQSVSAARKRAGSDTSVAEAAAAAQAERQRHGWWIGTWEVKDPAGWMRFTFRPDQRYMVTAGDGGAAKEVERGSYRLTASKLTLAPYPGLYPGLGDPRGFQVDFYDGALFLIGDSSRFVVARKVPGSETAVTQATENPEALKGELDPLVGLWNLRMTNVLAELLFRQDGQFRLTRCLSGVSSDEYGLYAVDWPSRTLTLASRLTEMQTIGLDFYGDTMTLFGTNFGVPVTYVTTPERTQAALEASLAADIREAELAALWLTRVPLGPRNPAAQVPPMPFDARPRHVFEGATVFTRYRLYERLIPSYVGLDPVINRREWHFLPSGRVMIRFVHHRSDNLLIVREVIDTWAAYRIEPKPVQEDILHRYADNVVFVETDAGELLELTLEDGRRHLFWDTDRMELTEWTAEKPPPACQTPTEFDPNLMNTGVMLRSTIAPDAMVEAKAIRFTLTGPTAGQFTITVTGPDSGRVVTEWASSLALPISWKALQTNAVPGGPLSFTIPQPGSPQAYFRLRWP